MQDAAVALIPLVAGMRRALELVAANAPVRPATPPAPAATPAESRDAATQLMTLLSQFDPGAADFMEGHDAALRALFVDGTWDKFEDLVRGYAFADAEGRLAEALKGLGT
jgi:hypothetical protein